MKGYVSLNDVEVPCFHSFIFKLFSVPCKVWLSNVCNKQHASITVDSPNKPRARVAHCTPSCHSGEGRWRGGGGAIRHKPHQGQKGAGAQSIQGRRLALRFFSAIPIRVKLAADEVKHSAGGEEQQSAGKNFPGPKGKMVRVELEWDIPMSVTLPVRVHPDPVDRPFPFLDRTLADLGIKEWVCAFPHLTEKRSKPFQDLAFNFHEKLFHPNLFSLLLFLPWPGQMWRRGWCGWTPRRPRWKTKRGSWRRKRPQSWRYFGGCC